MTAEIKPIGKKKNHIKGLAPKLIFLLLLLCMGLAISVISHSIKKDKPSVLGASYPEINLNPSDDIKKIANSITTQSKNIVSETIGTTSQIISDTASRSASIVSQTIYDNTFGKLVDQVRNLPPDQQIKIKEQICK